MVAMMTYVTEYQSTYSLWYGYKSVKKIGKPSHSLTFCNQEGKFYSEVPFYMNSGKNK